MENHFTDLYPLKLLQRQHDHALENIATLAASICNVNIGAITLIDKNKQLTAACSSSLVNIPAEISLEYSFCIHTIQHSFFEVPHAPDDERFSTNPLVKMGINYYAGVPIKSPNGNAIGALCIVNNKKHQLSESQISNLKLLARQVDMVISNRYLHQQTEEQLKQAEAKNRLELVMLSLIAHEIKTPLNNINPLLSLFREGLLNKEELNQLLEDTQERVDTIAENIHKIVTLGKLLFQSSAASTFFLPYNIVNNIGEQYQQDLEVKQNTFTIHNHVLQTVYGDENGITLLLNTLVGNANKFTCGGNIDIYILREGNSLIFKVIDEGMGMEEKTLNLLLGDKPMNPSRGTHNEKGSGVGLILVKEYLKAKNGRLLISSAHGRGSSFTVVLEDIQFVNE